MTDEEKAIIRAEARAVAFEAGVTVGRQAANDIDTFIYSRDDMNDLREADIYAKEYVRAFMEAFERAFKRRADENDRARYDIRINQQRTQKKETTS